MRELALKFAASEQQSNTATPGQGMCDTDILSFYIHLYSTNRKST